MVSMENLKSNELSHCYKVTKSIKKNMHILNEFNTNELNLAELVSFNNHVVLSECIPFLKAIQNEVGEIHE